MNDSVKNDSDSFVSDSGSVKNISDSDMNGSVKNDSGSV